MDGEGGPMPMYGFPTIAGKHWFMRFHAPNVPDFVPGKIKFTNFLQILLLFYTIF